MTALDPATRFERIYERSDDPWNYHASGYEAEKYQATLAALPDGRAVRCLEVGCSIGVFTKLLAERCESVVAIDFSERAVSLAANNLTAVENVELRAAAFPEQVRRGHWDLIICSEVLYYLDEAHLSAAIKWLSQQLRLGACIVAVSWRGVGTDEPFLGDHVHDRLGELFAAWHTLDARQERYRLDRFEGAR